MKRDEVLAEALKTLRAGGTILYPTDTVWGLGCDATNPEAVAKIYAIKRRSEAKSLVLLAADLDMVAKYVRQVPSMAVDLVEVNDKPMTIIYPDAQAGVEGEPGDRWHLAWNAVAEDGSVGMRIPLFDFCKDLAFKLGRPVVSTSANISGEPTPARFSEIPQRNPAGDQGRRRFRRPALHRHRLHRQGLPDHQGGHGWRDRDHSDVMELFYAYEADGRSCRLDADESGHCVRVLRHRAGDEIHVIDGLGTMYRCRLTDDSPKGAEAEVLEAFPGWGGHPYRLTVACCPTKNNDRFEWFVEKATEVGVDRIVPTIGERSERKVYKTDRALRISLSATKQSLKARIPEIAEPIFVKDFICHSEPAEQAKESLKLIAYCFEGDTKRISIQEALKAYEGKDITILIGPEGDFSPEEARLAVEHGYIPVHLGASRLRTETAAVLAATAVYLSY